MKRNTLILVAIALCAFLVIGYPINQTKDDRAEVALQAAIKTETVDGNLKAAIEQYQKLANGSNRALAAKALVRMGQCHEKLGDAEARKAYERVVRDFADQRDALAEAQKYLAANASQSETGLNAKLVFTTEDGRLFGESISRDGRYIAFTMPYGYGTGPVIMIQDLVKREERKIITAGVYAETNVNGAPDDTAMISPDGRQVAFWSSTTTEGQKLHVINADGSNPRILMSVKTGAESLCGWSPDGNQILATSSPAGPMNNQLLTISVADGSSKVIASGSVLDASFSPDGRYIAIEKVALKPPCERNFHDYGDWRARSVAGSTQQCIPPDLDRGWEKSPVLPVLVDWRQRPVVDPSY